MLYEVNGDILDQIQDVDIEEISYEKEIIIERNNNNDPEN